ncbi:hypothetical protein LTR62_001246 [Meristemomyces frigidus]|uniref:Fungal lipase-type domain-containing protein n=1 Tax=Meristemomyces frigidus TaxID=1508187 RepID=A0AAN7TGC0_9PEZI|nr:hypothetical protein LTR62_001246 [Meristemomyces frigidus]
MGLALLCWTHLCIITAAAAAAPAEQSLLVQHAHNDRSASASLFLELEEFARITDITYCVGVAGTGIIKPFECLSRCSDFPAFELVRTWNTGPLLDDSSGYIALDHAKQRLIVAIRGTYSISSALVDLLTLPAEYSPYLGGEGDQPVCHSCSVHAGFQRSWGHTQKMVMDALQDQVASHPSYALHVVGHSLGGVVAGFAGLDMMAHGWQPTITTFGEPRGGNKAFVEWFDARYGLNESTQDRNKLKYRRVTHVDDPIPQVPPTEFGFLPHAGEIYISKAALSPDLADLQHCMGSMDKNCIAGQDPTIGGDLGEHSAGFSLHVPARWKLWNMLFAHRDYFWRLGLCVPGGDPGRYEEHLPRG